jgi:hypothetical protein
MIIFSAVIILYGVALSACFYFLTPKPEGAAGEEASSGQITTDAAKRTLQSIKTIDRKEADRQSEVGTLFIESMKAALERLNTAAAIDDKHTDAERVQVKTVGQN